MKTGIIKVLAEPITHLILNRSSVNTKKELENDLTGLNPGDDPQRLIMDYYTEKVTKELLLFSTLFILAFAVLISRFTSGKITSDGMIPRKAVGDGNYVMELDAKTNDHEYGTISVEIEEQLLSEEEVIKLMDELYERLLVIVPGDGKELSHIDEDLHLPSSVEGYPFSIRWESSDNLLIDTLGNVNNEELEDPEGIPVDLTVYITYKETVRPYDVKLVVYPPLRSENDTLLKSLYDRMGEVNSQTGTDEYYILPSVIDGKQIEWKEKKEPLLPLLSAVAFLAMVLAWFGPDRDMRKKSEDRKKQMMADYAEFVSKLQILLSSGSTIRGTLEKMAADYRQNCWKGGKKRYVYEELVICLRKLGDGLSESACYESFGRRCGIVCYKKLASLLIQNLRKGNEGLISALDNEVNAAFEERKACARRMGEEAQTKLMLPMIMMLGVVMILIMIPAYLSFGGM